MSGRGAEQGLERTARRPRGVASIARALVGSVAFSSVAFARRFAFSVAFMFTFSVALAVAFAMAAAAGASEAPAASPGGGAARASETASESEAAPRAVAAPAPISDAAIAEVEALQAYGELPLDALRFLGTHNSYHRRPRLFGIPFLPIAFSKSHRYGHPPLPVQLEGLPDGTRAVRQLEIDLHMRRLDDQIRVFHLPWIDNRSTCKTLERCLEQLLAWSDARAGEHAPVLVWLEPKDETPLDRWITLGWYEHVDLARVEAVILKVIPRDRILTPDEVRRGAATLPEAIRRHGWPTLEETRGRFIFALLDSAEHRAAYVARSPNRNLEGQLMFVRSMSPDEPWAAMFKVVNAMPTLRDMQAFGREALADPELAALQVIPPTPSEAQPDSPFKQFFRSLWTSMQMVEAAEREGPPGDEAAPSKDEPGPGPDTAMEAGTQPGPASKRDLDAEEAEAVEVARAVRRELRWVDPDTPKDERAMHDAAVAALESQAALSSAPESEELAIVLRNASASSAYRDVLVVRLREFLEAKERATILQLASQRFLVTTTADDRKSSGARNRERAASAFFSAAQFISTDALVPQDDTRYTMPFPGRPIDCNSLLDPDACDAARSPRRPLSSSP